MAMVAYARKHYGLELEHDPHRRLPLLGEHGCTAEPHLRPVCALHACCIAGMGYKTRGEHADQWTKRYFELREQIEEIEWHVHGEPDNGFDDVFEKMECAGGTE